VTTTKNQRKQILKAIRQEWDKRPELPLGLLIMEAVWPWYRDKQSPKEQIAFDLCRTLMGMSGATVLQLILEQRDAIANRCHSCGHLKRTTNE